MPSCKRPGAVSVPGICPRFSLMPMRAMRLPSWRPLGIVTLFPASVRKAGLPAPSSAGHKGWPMGRGKSTIRGGGSNGVEVRALYGTARLKHILTLLGYKHINTSGVERHNGTSRLRNQRKVRKTLAFSNAPRYHRWMSWLSVGLYNFCRGHSRLKSIQATQVQQRSPAMAAR